jgi:predicted lipoprotein with Yx(FWY)xxD motif
MGRNRYLAAGLVAAALITAACSSSPAPVPKLKTTTVNGATVLTNAGGFTLYWFSIDNPANLPCNGPCAAVWRPVPGPVTAADGVTGTLGTVGRLGYQTQATYDGHPLYTYTGDTAPGQAKGNGVTAYGGVWHKMTVSGNRTESP